MIDIVESTHIAGVKLANLRSYGDERGRFVETFRADWFPERAWNVVQTNRSDSRSGVLRGLHYHFNQVDYWCPVAGRMRVGMADLRQGSPSYGVSQVIDLDGAQPVGVFIPVGVAHGFYAVTDVILTYVVDNYYSGDDEFGVAWNDPDLAVPWNVEDPILSGRDAQNALLTNIAADYLPHYSENSNP